MVPEGWISSERPLGFQSTAGGDGVGAGVVGAAQRPNLAEALVREDEGARAMLDCGTVACSDL